MADLAVPGNLAVAPPAPLRIEKEQGDGLALVGPGPRQAVGSIGRKRVKEGIAPGAGTDLGQEMVEPGLAGGQDAVKAVAEPTLLAVRENHHGREAEEASVLLLP